MSSVAQRTSGGLSRGCMETIFFPWRLAWSWRNPLDQYAGVYTPVLQSGHQFCIGNGCWGSAATSAVKHLGRARLPLSPPCNHVVKGRRVPTCLCNGGGGGAAGSRIMSASDSSATGLIGNKVRLWCSSFCLTTLHADSASSSTSHPSVGSEMHPGFLSFLSLLSTELLLWFTQFYPVFTPSVTHLLYT